MKDHDDAKPPKPDPNGKHAKRDEPAKHEKPVAKQLPGQSGPQERGLAIELTLAVLGIAEFADTDPMAIAKATGDVYRHMLELVGPAGPQPLRPGHAPSGDDRDDG